MFPSVGKEKSYTNLPPLVPETMGLLLGTEIWRISLSACSQGAAVQLRSRAICRKVPSQMPM